MHFLQEIKTSVPRKMKPSLESISGDLDLSSTPCRYEMGQREGVFCANDEGRSRICGDKPEGHEFPFKMRRICFFIRFSKNGAG